MASVKHLMSLADLSVPQINHLLQLASKLKNVSTPLLRHVEPGAPSRLTLPIPPQTLSHKTVALIFNKRSTRTRVAAETATVLLGGRALFLGKEDIQLGVNETLRDSARVIGGMCQGIFARVGDHAEIEELAQHSPVPVINALSSLWHPTQTLADLLTLYETPSLLSTAPASVERTRLSSMGNLRPLTIAYVGDSTNVLHDMLVSYPRMGHKMRVATPPQAMYQCPTPVWDKVKELGCDKNIWWGTEPREAVNGADVIITDTWISMGQEAEKEQRLKDFAGYQVTEKMCAEGGAKQDWKFLHCLPRKEHEVDDEVFYGKRSLVFPESDNRKWTIMAVFNALIGRWNIPETPLGPTGW